MPDSRFKARQKAWTKTWAQSAALLLHCFLSLPTRALPQRRPQPGTSTDSKFSHGLLHHHLEKMHTQQLWPDTIAGTDFVWVAAREQLSTTLLLHSLPQLQTHECFQGISCTKWCPNYLHPAQNKYRVDKDKQSWGTSQLWYYLGPVTQVAPPIKKLSTAPLFVYIPNQLDHCDCRAQLG